jgi:hypothetical protein
MNLRDKVRRLVGLTAPSPFETHWGPELQEDVYAVGGRRPRMPRMPSSVPDHSSSEPVSPRPDILGDMRLTVRRAAAAPEQGTDSGTQSNVNE